MFHKTKINKNIIKRETARNYCNEDLILMDGVWLMKGYPEPNKPLQKTLEGMGDIKVVEEAINRILNRKFNVRLQYTPIIYKGARAIFNPATREYVFIRDDYLEMVNIEKCDIVGTDKEREPIIFENKVDANQWLLVMPTIVRDADKWLKKP